MYPLKGSGIAMFLPCRRSCSDYFVKTQSFYFRCRCCGSITGNPVAAFLDPISFVCVQKKRCRTAKENTLKGYVKIFCSSATDGRSPFGKTLPFYFRCRWSGGDLRYSRSSAPPHQRRSTMQALTVGPAGYNAHHWSGSDKQRL